MIKEIQFIILKLLQNKHLDSDDFTWTFYQMFKDLASVLHTFFQKTEVMGTLYNSLSSHWGKLGEGYTGSLFTIFVASHESIIISVLKVNKNKFKRRRII